MRAIRPKLRYTEMTDHDILHEANQRVERVYFPDSGLVSLVVVMSNGKTAEAGVVGHEGSTVVVVMNSLRLLFGKNFKQD